MLPPKSQTRSAGGKIPKFNIKSGNHKKSAGIASFKMEALDESEDILTIKEEALDELYRASFDINCEADQNSLYNANLPPLSNKSNNELANIYFNVDLENVNIESSVTESIACNSNLNDEKSNANEIHSNGECLDGTNEGNVSLDGKSILSYSDLPQFVVFDVSDTGVKESSESNKNLCTEIGRRRVRASKKLISSNCKQDTLQECEIIVIKEQSPNVFLSTQDPLHSFDHPTEGNDLKTTKSLSYCSGKNTQSTYRNDTYENLFDDDYTRDDEVGFDRIGGIEDDEENLCIGVKSISKKRENSFNTCSIKRSKNKSANKPEYQRNILNGRESIYGTDAFTGSPKKRVGEKGVISTSDGNKGVPNLLGMFRQTTLGCKECDYEADNFGVLMQHITRVHFHHR